MGLRHKDQLADNRAPALVNLFLFWLGLNISVVMAWFSQSLGTLKLVNVPQHRKAANF
jgi:hypothetical protein